MSDVESMIDADAVASALALPPAALADIFRRESAATLDMLAGAISADDGLPRGWQDALDRARHLLELSQAFEHEWDRRETLSEIEAAELRAAESEAAGSGSHDDSTRTEASEQLSVSESRPPAAPEHSRPKGDS